MNKMTKLAAALLSVAILAGCAGAPDPEPTATATPEPTHVVPQYDQEAAGEPPFTISGRGERIVRINFPSSTEPTIISASTNGRVVVYPLTVDGDKLQAIGTFDADKPNIAVVFPLEENLSASDEFLVETDEDVSWAVSTQALGSVPATTSQSIGGTSSTVFRLDVPADTMVYNTIGFGTTTIEVINLNTGQVVRAGRGVDTLRGITMSTTVDSSLISYQGYIFIVTAENPATQGWRLTFQQSQPDVTTQVRG
jgi:hypothetical protein